MIMNDELSRMGVSLPKNLLDKFDEIINYRGYSSRSEGIRDALRQYIMYYKWMSDVKGERQGVITLVYDRRHRNVFTALTDIQHEFMRTIQTSLYSQISPDKCLEVVLVRGDGSELKSLAEHLMSQKGIELVKLTTIQVND